MARKEEVDEKRLQMAAHLFIFTTREGMAICHLCKVLPAKLYEWTTTEAWREALKFWGYDGDWRIEGEEFHRMVALSLQKQSLEQAERLWRELFGQSERKTALHRFFGKELPTIEGTVAAAEETLNREVAVEH